MSVGEPDAVIVEGARVHRPLVHRGWEGRRDQGTRERLGRRALGHAVTREGDEVVAFVGLVYLIIELGHVVCPLVRMVVCSQGNPEEKASRKALGRARDRPILSVAKTVDDRYHPEQGLFEKFEVESEKI